MLQHWKTRRGAVAVQVALCLIPIMGVAAISMDGGLLYDQRRRTQAAADAAALAASADLYQNYPLYRGLDGTGTARAGALHVAAANGYNNDGTHSTVTVNIPPTSGLFSGQRGNVEVIIQTEQSGCFSSIFGASSSTVRARSVARGQWRGYLAAVITLAPTLRGSLAVTGNGTTTVTGAGVIIDSNDPQAVITSGGSTVTSSEFSITGDPGFSSSGKSVLQGEIDSGMIPVPDPLAYLPVVDPNTLPVRSTSQLSLTNSVSVTLDPGVYIGGIKVTDGLLTLRSGIYYMQGGGFSASGHATIRGEGVMLYNALGGAIVINEPGGVTMSPMTTGVYAGITLFQDRRSDSQVSLAGNGGMSITGTLYAAGARVKLTGNGITNVMGSQVICHDLQLGGNGSINVAWNDNDTAKTRALTLVE